MIRLNDLYKQISVETGISCKTVELAYKSFWKFIRETIKSLPLKDDLTESEFNMLRTSFNIPSIGKLHCTYDRYEKLKKKYRHSMDLHNEKSGNDD